MLTGELVRVQAREGKLRPSYVKRDARHEERAKEILDLYHRGLAARWTRGRLDQELDEIIGDGVDHKLTRGLAKVLADAAEWEAEPSHDPAQLRERLFDAVGGAPSRERASEALASMAQEFGCTEDDLRRMLYADRKDEQQLRALPTWREAEALLDRYDTALVQAVLVQAISLKVSLRGASPGRLQQLFRALKFHQLMFRLEQPPDGVIITIDGPTSIIRQSTRYGAQMARWFPHLLAHKGPWEMDAEVRWNTRKVSFALDHTRGLQGDARDEGGWLSNTEKMLIERFASADTQGWELIPGAEVVDLGQDVICPDFTLRKGDRTALLEVVGYWRKDWLERRLELLRKNGPGNLILAVSSRLDVGPAVELKGPLIPFKEVVPLKDLLAAAERCARTPAVR